MTKKSMILGATALILAGLVTSPKLVGAYQGDPNLQGPNCTPERHEAMERAFDNKDYDSWKNLMSGKGRVSQVITEENFARFAEAHQLVKEGKSEEAKQIRQELGLGLGGRNGLNDGQGNKGQGMDQGRNR
jgi:hypothetical protein